MTIFGRSFPMPRLMRPSPFIGTTPPVSKSGSDTGTGTEAVTNLSATLSDNDTGTGVDSGSVVFTFTNDFETGTNATAISTANSGGTTQVAFSNCVQGSGAVNQYSSTQVAHGSLSMVFSTGATAAQAYNRWDIPDTVDVGWRFYVYLTAAPAAEYTLCEFMNVTADCAKLRLTTARTLKFWDSANLTITNTTSTTVLALNQWYRVEAKLHISSTAGSVEYKIFSSMDSTTADETLTSASTQNLNTTFNRIQVGVALSAANIPTTYLDDFALNNTGAYPGPSTTTTPISSSDTGSGAEATVSLGTSPVTQESGAAVEATSLAATPPTTADTGAGSETATLPVIGVNNADASAQSTDAGVLTLTTSTDTATGSETPAPTVALSAPTDTGSDVETALITLPVQADAATATETVSIGVPVSGSDTGSGSDTQAVAPTTAVPDTGSGVEATSTLLVSSTSDTATATDTQGTLGVTAVTTEVGTSTEVGVTSVGPTGSDSATSVDATLALSASVPSADTATALEGVPTLSLSVADTATATETVAVSVPVSGADTATAGDVAAVSAAVVGVESGGASDGALPAPSTLTAPTDAATATEPVGVVAFTAPTDAATSTSQNAVPGPSGFDTALSVEGVGTFGVVAAAASIDFAASTQSVLALLASLSVADGAVAVDSATAGLPIRIHFALEGLKWELGHPALRWEFVTAGLSTQ